MGMSYQEKMRRVDLLLQEAGAVRAVNVVDLNLQLFFYTSIPVRYFLDKTQKNSKVYGIVVGVSNKASVTVLIEDEPTPVAISCLKAIEKAF